MIYKKDSRVKLLLTSILFRIILKINNIGNSDPNSNGEFSFLRRFLNFDCPKHDIFDIGANKGDWSNEVLRINKNIKLHLFEPQVELFKSLSKEYYKTNNFGLSDQNLNTTLYRDKEGSGLASIYDRNLSYYNINFSSKENIKLIRADEYIEKNNIKHISMVKIDVEGHELEVLKGFGQYLKPDFIDLIQFEYGGANLDSGVTLRDIIYFLEDNDFIVCKIMKSGYLVQTSWDPTMENFVNRNFISVSKNFKENYNL